MQRTDEDQLFGLDGTTLTLSPQGSVSHTFTALAVGPEADQLGVADVPSDGTVASLHTIHTTTGATTPVGDLVDDPDQFFAGLAVLADGRTVASSQDLSPFETGAGSCGRWTPASGAATALGEAQNGVIVTLAGGCADTVFGVDESNRLVHVDPSTWHGDSGTDAGPAGPRLGVGPVLRRPGSGAAAAHTAGSLYDVDQDTGEATRQRSPGLRAAATSPRSHSTHRRRAATEPTPLSHGRGGSPG